MRSSYSFVIIGEPRGKGRPRFTRDGHTYTDSETRAYEKKVRQSFISAYHRFEPFPKGEPIRAMITAYYAIPKSESKIKRELMATGYIRPTKKPDTDNIAKIVLDSLNGLAYHDDAQVVTCEVRKYYGVEPRVEVFIGEVMNE